MTSRLIPLIHGLREIAPDYDALIVDLWGVIHGGIEPYPGVLDTLTALRSAAKPVALLSNAPRRAATAIRRLTQIGVPPSAYDCLITSGEATHDDLAARAGADGAALGPNYFYIGPAWDADLVAGLDYHAVGAVEEADFLLAVGLFDEADPLDSYDPLFASAAARELVMVCVNPDLVVHRQSGVTSPCAGLLAQRYAAQGGRVIYHGKPDPAIFRRAARALGQAEDGRILVIGDSLATDIKGAAAAGYDSLFVTRGILAEELGIRPGDEPHAARLAELCARHGQSPTAAIATLRW
jgi:HAD superfamily hydrolase (TIGR01459 family)